MQISVSLRIAHIQALARLGELLHRKNPQSKLMQPPAVMRTLVQVLANNDPRTVTTPHAIKHATAPLVRRPKKLRAGSIAAAKHPSAKRPHNRPLVLHLDPVQLTALDRMARTLAITRSQCCQALVFAMVERHPALRAVMAETWDPTLTFHVN